MKLKISLLLSIGLLCFAFSRLGDVRVKSYVYQPVESAESNINSILEFQLHITDPQNLNYLEVRAKSGKKERILQTARTLSFEDGTYLIRGNDSRIIHKNEVKFNVYAHVHHHETILVRYQMNNSKPKKLKL